MESELKGFMFVKPNELKLYDVLGRFDSMSEVREELPPVGTDTLIVVLALSASLVVLAGVVSLAACWINE